jgi:hypothetical protein
MVLRDLAGGHVAVGCVHGVRAAAAAQEGVNHGAHYRLRARCSRIARLIRNTSATVLGTRNRHPKMRFCQKAGVRSALVEYATCSIPSAQSTRNAMVAIATRYRGSRRRHRRRRSIARTQAYHHDQGWQRPRVPLPSWGVHWHNPPSLRQEPRSRSGPSWRSRRANGAIRPRRRSQCVTNRHSSPSGPLALRAAAPLTSRPCRPPVRSSCRRPRARDSGSSFHHGPVPPLLPGCVQ